jgi:hypothetical protein
MSTGVPSSLTQFARTVPSWRMPARSSSVSTSARMRTMPGAERDAVSEKRRRHPKLDLEGRPGDHFRQPSTRQGKVRMSDMDDFGYEDEEVDDEMLDGFDDIDAEGEGDAEFALDAADDGDEMYD